MNFKQKIETKVPTTLKTIQPANMQNKLLPNLKIELRADSPTTK